MKVFLGSKCMCEIPDILSVGDTIIFDNKDYEIITKTFDVSSNDLYCKVHEYNEGKINKLSVADVFEEIYGSNMLTTSGANTNDVINNPRLIIFTTIAIVVLGPVSVNKYRDKVINMWNCKNIPFIDIFNDNPDLFIDNVDHIKKIVVEMLIKHKISKEIWPKSCVI